MSMNHLNDITAIYMQEVFKPQLGKGGGSSPEGGKKVEKGKDDSESSAKRIRQAVYDIRYRARREDVKLDQAFSQYMGHTTMNAQEKAAVKEKLGLTAGASSGPVKEETEAKKYKVRVKDKESGKSYVRYATREKISQLRSNPNISSVEMTGYGDPYEGERKKGEQTAKAKAGKGLDPVGREDKDIDNDGDHDKTDKYLLNRRKVRGAAIATRKEGFEIDEAHATAKQIHSPHEVPSGNLKGLVAKAVKRIDTDVDGDTDHNDKAKGELGEFVPGVGNKRLYSSTKTKTAKESFSNWREDLIEVLDSSEEPKQIKEKKVKNVIKINPELKESVESLGGLLIDVTELNCVLEEISDEELNFLSDDLIEDVVEEVFYEFLDEGYDIDSIENILCESLDVSYELINEKVDMAARAAARKKYAAASEKSAKEARKRGADVVKKEKRAEKIQKVKDTVKKIGSSLKSGLKKAGKSAVTGASYAAGKAVGTAKKVVSAAKAGYEAGKKSTESGDSGANTTKTRAPKTYRYARPESKKRSGLASKVGSLLKKGLKKAVGKTARVVSKGADKVASKLGEEKDPCWKGYTMVGMKKKGGKEVPNCVPAKGVKKAKGFKEDVEQIDEKITAKTDMGDAIKDFQSSKSSQLAGRTKEERRQAAIAAVLTARRGGKKLGEAVTQISGKETTPPKETTAKQDDVQRKQMLANKQKMMQKQMMLQRQQLQLQKQGKLPMGHAAEEFEYSDELISEDEYRRMLAKERQAERESEKNFREKGGIGDKKKGPKLSSTKKSAAAGADYAKSQMGSIKIHDKASKGKHTVGNPFPEQVEYEIEEGVRPTPVDKPLDKEAFKKRRKSLKGYEQRGDAKKRGHQGKEWYNSGRTYSPDEAKRSRAKMDDEERRTRHRSAVDPDNEDDNNYSADKTKNPKKIRKQKAMGELGEAILNELRRSEKEGKGSPEMRTKSGHLVGARGERKRKGEMGGRHFWSGGEGGSRTERGKKKGEEGSQQKRMNPSAQSKIQQIIKKRESTRSSRFD